MRLIVRFRERDLFVISPMSLFKKLSLLIAFLWAAQSLCLAEMKITFIDAGQADAALIQIDQTSGEPFTILVDGGDGDSDLEDNLPTLLTHDSIIELVVLSHPHRDHTGGLDWLVTQSNITVQRVWWTEEFSAEGNYVNFQAGILQNSILAVRPHEQFYNFIGAPNFTLRVFNNGQEFSSHSGRAINNDSLVFQVIYEPATGVNVTALFPGDIEKSQGKMLVKQYGDDLKSDIVKVPHHGSDHFADEFPEKVDASIAVVSSTGTHGTFKHPRKVALDAYQDAVIYCTCDEAGNTLHITVSVSDTGSISVNPDPQPPYFVWDRDANGVLQRVVIP